MLKSCGQLICIRGVTISTTTKKAATGVRLNTRSCFVTSLAAESLATQCREHSQKRRFPYIMTEVDEFGKEYLTPEKATDQIAILLRCVNIPILISTSKRHF